MSASKRAPEREPPGTLPNLTAKQSAFVAKYLTNGKKTVEAYRAAYSPFASESTARVESWRLLRNPKIAQHIEAAAAVERQMQNCRVAVSILSKIQVAERLTAIALDPKTPVKEQRAALVDLSRVMGYIEEKRAVRVIRSIQDLSQEELEALAESSEVPEESIN